MERIVWIVLTYLVTVQCQTITVTNGETGGIWRSMQNCPAGAKAYGYDTQNKINLGIDRPIVDDTALNTVRLYCDDLGDTNITSFAGDDGSWGDRLNCVDGNVLVAFRLRVSPNGNTTDNTAANNIHFKCSNGRILNGSGNSAGYWGDWSAECLYGICGIQTRYSARVPLVDSTAVNDVRFQCCSP